MERFAVIGLGQFGGRLATRLTELGFEVLAIDGSQAVVDVWKDVVDQAIALDATDEVAFRDCGIEEVDTAIVAVGRQIEVSVLVAAHLVKLGIPRLVARAASERHAEILRAIGIDEIVNPEQDMADRTAERLIARDVRDRMVLPTGHEYLEVDAPPSMVGKRLLDTPLHHTHDVHVVGLWRHVPEVTTEGESRFARTMVADPSPEETLVEGDILALVGSAQRVRELTRS